MTFVYAIAQLTITYILAYFLLIQKIKSRYLWDIFTRLMSTVNALQCVYTVLIYVVPNYYSYMNLHHVGNSELSVSLYWFAAYLFVDGVFCLVDYLSKPSKDLLASLAHHFVGGLGIYLIASENRGLGLGAYFAWTEISTPLLNISWFLYINDIDNSESRMIYVIFYMIFTISRIVTLPLLYSYIYHNKHLIALESIIPWFMVYAGSLTLAVLNSIWFVMITIKIGIMILAH